MSGSTSSTSSGPMTKAYNIEDLRIMARRRLPKVIFDYLDGDNARALELLEAEIIRGMKLMGLCKVAEITPDCLRRRIGASYVHQDL